MESVFTSERQNISPHLLAGTESKESASPSLFKLGILSPLPTPLQHCNFLKKKKKKKSPGIKPAINKSSPFKGPVYDVRIGAICGFSFWLC
jgi:hypothetical protein